MCNTKELLAVKRRVKELEAEQESLTAELTAERFALVPSGTIDIYEMSSILLDKLEEMGDDKADLYLADVGCKVYNKADVVNFLSLNEVDKIPYVTEKIDCDDFAAKLYVKGAGLIWTTVHAINWFIDENNDLWFIEPQTDKISQNLEEWQGWDVRFFLSR